MTSRQLARPAPLGATAVGDARIGWTARVDGSASLVVGDGAAQARAALLAQVGLAPGDAVFMAQVHGGDVAVVGPADRGRGLADHAEAVPGVDALVTTATDVALVVLVADCVPVLLVQPGVAVAAVHAGRRGVAQGVVPAAVAAVRSAGQAADAPVAAVVGPAIGGCCYEVPADLRDEVAAVVPAARAATSTGSPALDLRAAVAAQLAAAGVTDVQVVGGCTRCEADRWFSHRATTGQGARAGRNAMVVARRSDTSRASDGAGAPPQDPAGHSVGLDP